MMWYETITLCVALLSVVIALVSLVRTRKIASEQLRLGRITARLAEKQIDQLEEETLERDQPKLHVDLTKLGSSNTFIVSNRGGGSAYQVGFELIDCKASPLMPGELAEKLPYPEIKSQSRFKLRAATHLGSPRAYQVRLTWEDGQGIEHKEDFHVSL